MEKVWTINTGQIDPDLTDASSVWPWGQEYKKQNQLDNHQMTPVRPKLTNFSRHEELLG